MTVGPNGRLVTIPCEIFKRDFQESYKNMYNQRNVYAIVYSRWVTQLICPLLKAPTCTHTKEPCEMKKNLKEVTFIV